jgi:hypothetical protein
MDRSSINYRLEAKTHVATRRLGLAPRALQSKGGEWRTASKILYVQKGKARVMTQRLGLASGTLESRIVLLLGTLPTRLSKI